MAQTDGEAGTGAQESDAGVQKSRPSARCLSRVVAEERLRWILDNS